MFFSLKRAFMKRMIAKKQRAKPFDLAGSEAYELPGDAPPTVNNSYYFSAHDTEGRSLYCRLGLRTSHTEVWFVYHDGEHTYTHKTMLYKENAPLCVEREPGGWLVRFRGELTDDSGAVLSAEYEGHFVSTACAVDFFSHMPPVRTAIAMAGEKWSRGFFGEVQKNNQVHYEEFGRLFGKMTIEGAVTELDLPAVRDHSFGRRIWDYMNNHLWLMAVNEKEQLNFSMVSYPAMSILEVGNFKPAEGEMDFVLSAEYDRSAVIGARAKEPLAISLRMASGKTLSVVAECEFSTEYLFEDGRYRLLEGVGHFTVNGVRFRGIIEMGENRDKTRHFNGKEIKKLRV